MTVQIDIPELLRTAYHEAGHAARAYYLRTPISRVHVHMFNGHVLADLRTVKDADCASILWSGPLAELWSGLSPAAAVDDFAAKDYEELRELDCDSAEARAKAEAFLKRNWTAVQHLALALYQASRHAGNADRPGMTGAEVEKLLAKWMPRRKRRSKRGKSANDVILILRPKPKPPRPKVRSNPIVTLKPKPARRPHKRAEDQFLVFLRPTRTHHEPNRKAIDALRERHGLDADASVGFATYGDVRVKAASSDHHTFTAIISTADLDLDNEVLLPSGCDAEDFNSTGAVFWNHDYDRPVAVPGKLRISGDRIAADAVFLRRPADYKGEWHPDFGRAYVRQMADAGRRAGVSVGFLPIEMRRATREDRKLYGPAVERIVTKWKLLEWSIAPVQANPRAGVTSSGGVRPKSRKHFIIITT